MPQVKPRAAAAFQPAKMRRSVKVTKSGLMVALEKHTRNIHETLKIFDEPAASLEKTDWKQVIKVGEDISKQATIAGMLWTGEAPKATELEESMDVYFNLLNGLLLLCHGSTVGSGASLQACICAAVKQVIESSLTFMQAAVYSYETRSAVQKQSIPKHVGLIWEACQALKTTPTSNSTAVGRKIIQVAASVKDVLRELKELKLTDPATSTETNAGRTHAQSESPVDDEDESSSGSDIDNNLSPEEMAIAELVMIVVTDTLQIIKELVRFISAFSKKPDNANDNCLVGSMENILKTCEHMGVQIDDIGASVYPPQEIIPMQNAIQKLRDSIGRMQSEVQTLDAVPEGLAQAGRALGSSLDKLDRSLKCLDEGTFPEIRKLDLNS